MNYLKKKKISNPTRLSKVKKCYWTAAGAAVLCLCCVTPAMAAGSDPLDIVNNLSDFIFSMCPLKRPPDRLSRNQNHRSHTLERFTFPSGAV